MPPRLAAALAAALLAALPAATPAAPRWVPGEVLVKFRTGTSPARSAAAISALAHTPLAALDAGWTQVRVRPEETVDQALAAYAADPDVEWAQPNYRYRATGAVVPDDPDYSQQWALRNVGQEITSQLQGGMDAYYAPTVGVAGNDLDIEAAWALTTDCSGAVVAVVDTGVNYRHPDLAANMWVDPAGVYTNHGADFIDGDGDPMDLHGHGTHVAGIIGAVGNNGAGTSGVCWRARIMAVRVLDAVGGGTTLSIARGLEFAAARGATVVNLSLGGEGNDALMSSAVAAAASAGAVVVAAAGNDQEDNDGPHASFPCADPNPSVLCVAAVDARFGLAEFSNWGLRSVDVGAPGVNILGPWPGSQTVEEDAFEPGSFGGVWTRTSTGGGGFGVGTYRSTSFLVDPASYLDVAGAAYRPGTTDRAWRTFDTAGADAVTLELHAAINLAPPDWFRIACSPSGGSPFSSVVLEDLQGVRTGKYGLYPFEEDLSRCRGVGATVGFELQSTGAASGAGILITPLRVKKLRLDPPAPQYNTISGTSMAAPVVAGVAALLRTWQPAFTAADVIGAVKGGGRHAPSLDGRTVSRNVVQARGALEFVNPPRGLTYTVH